MTRGRRRIDPHLEVAMVIDGNIAFKMLAITGRVTDSVRMDVARVLATDILKRLSELGLLPVGGPQ